MSSQTDEELWKEWGNLAFYKTGRPDYFYFNLLLKYYERRSAEYNQKAYNIGQAAQNQYQNAVSNMYAQQKEDNTPEQNKIDALNKIIKMLDQTIEIQRANEIAFFKNRYESWKKTFGDETKKLKSTPEFKAIEQLFKEGANGASSFDYDNFNIALNVLLQGYKNTKSIFSFEENRLRQIQTIFDESRKISDDNFDKFIKTQKQYNGTARGIKAEKSHKYRRTRAEVNVYLRHHQFTDNKSKTLPSLRVKSKLEQITGTVDYEVAKWLNDNLLKLLDNQQIIAAIGNQIQLYAPQLLNGKSKIQCENTIKGILIQNLTNYSIEHISDIIEKRLKNNAVATIITDMINNNKLTYNFQIEGLYDTFGLQGKHLDYFDDSVILKNGAKSAAKLYDAMAALVTQITNPKKNSRGQNIYQTTADQQLAYNLFEQYDPDILLLVQNLNYLESLVQQVKKAASENKKELKLVINTYKQAANSTSNLPSQPINITLKFQNGELTNESAQRFANAIKNRASQAGLNPPAAFTNINSLISRLKRYTSERIRDSLDNIMNQTITQNTQQIQAIIPRSLQKGLENIRVNIDAPSLSEVTQGFQLAHDNKNIKLMWIGKAQQKNDYEVTVITPIETIKANLKNKVSEKMKLLIDDISTTISEVQEQYAKEYTDSIHSLLKELAQKKQYNQFDIVNQQINKSQALLEDNTKKAEEIIKDSTTAKKLANIFDRIDQTAETAEKAAQIKQAVLQEIANFFYESSTMKTYATYFNDVGFIGGSLGKGVLKQLEKLNQIFSAAGLNLEQNGDLKWLAGAIINCSPYSVMGEKQKNEIEEYLGSLALFALFNEGAADAQFAATIVGQQQQVKELARPNFLHLYRLNGVYFCASYLLSMVRKELNHFMQELNKVAESFTNHANIQISNTMHPGMLPNRDSFSDSDPWETVAKNAEENVSINIVFLGGLLDILNKLNAQMNGLEFPT